MEKRSMIAQEQTEFEAVKSESFRVILRPQGAGIDVERLLDGANYSD